MRFCSPSRTVILLGLIIAFQIGQLRVTNHSLAEKTRLLWVYIRAQNSELLLESQWRRNV